MQKTRSVKCIDDDILFLRSISITVWKLTLYLVLLVLVHAHDAGLFWCFHNPVGCIIMRRWGGGGGEYLIGGNKNKEHMLLLGFLGLCESKQPPFRVSDNMMCSCVSSGVFICLQWCVRVSPVVYSCVPSDVFMCLQLCGVLVSCVKPNGQAMASCTPELLKSWSTPRQGELLPLSSSATMIPKTVKKWMCSCCGRWWKQKPRTTLMLEEPRVCAMFSQACLCYVTNLLLNISEDGKEDCTFWRMLGN